MLKEISLNVNLPSKQNKEQANLKHKNNLPYDNSTKKELTINFMADAKQAVRSIVTSLDCSQQCKQIVTHVLTIYAQKINKLREERNYFKGMLLGRQKEYQVQKEEYLELKSKVSLLEQQISTQRSSVCQRCNCLELSNVVTQKYSIHNTIQQYTSHNNIIDSKAQISQVTINDIVGVITKAEDAEQSINEEDQVQLNGQKSVFAQQNQSLLVCQLSQSLSTFNNPNTSLCYSPPPANVKDQDLSKLMVKYNIGAAELMHMLEQYQKEEVEAQQRYDNQQHKQLYRMGQKLHKDILRRKVISDVKKLSTLKKQIVKKK